ncbi:unnamed protein product [Periconia digitata]|uniref:Uncharacterized protein n=1 Tax=Periconia digitata TaxID=1303443 RepID=A0A9W4U2E5_9PLEO|nr:unnamed protein product [Periconia digitata]
MGAVPDVESLPLCQSTWAGRGRIARHYPPPLVEKRQCNDDMMRPNTQLLGFFFFWIGIWYAQKTVTRKHEREGGWEAHPSSHMVSTPRAGNVFLFILTARACTPVYWTFQEHRVLEDPR